MLLEHWLISFAVGIISAIIAYAVYRKTSVTLWAYIAGFLPDMPVFILVPFGVVGLGNFLLFSHTIGIFIWPIILVIVDIFLIEARLLKYVILILRFLHLGFSTKTIDRMERIDSLLGRLEEYNIIPKPIRLGRVYAVGILAGIVHLAVNLSVGSL